MILSYINLIIVKFNYYWINKLRVFIQLNLKLKLFGNIAIACIELFSNGISASLSF